MPTCDADVVVEEQQNERIERRVGPGDKREDFVQFGRLLELRIDERQRVQRIPAHDKQ